ncbi:MAG: RluA family pseudouridine synthase [Pyrinomonadaceae bacterium]
MLRRKQRNENAAMSDEETGNSAETLTLRVPETESGARLDAYLAARVKDFSRARIKRLIEDGDVIIAGRADVKPSYKLHAHDEIEIELNSPLASNFAPENIPVEIVYEDGDIAVVNKPAGLVVHPGAGQASGTLANALAHRFQNLPVRGASLIQQSRPGIVHRLDKDTSGLIVVARNLKAHENLSDQFRNREVFKNYVALVHGRVAEDAGRIDQPIARDPSRRTRMAVVRGGRPALTLYRVRQRFERFTLLDVEIKTGRTHQIRVHLEWLKHPVVSDKTYGGGRDCNLSDVPQLRARLAALDRQFLHAEKLSFRHPQSGEKLSFTAALPAALAEFLDYLA